ncbi:type II toxin-antitoxin system HicA family toxin [Nitrolancea hollandica]|uniref:type II toxin-antitoxin system HicA family toxin n=1 Tax=Nitrolancea hollandica TaxID=1206749 RepID=UPI0034DF129C
MPRVTGAQLVRALKRAGWEPARRQRGSHVQLEHPDHVGIVTVPVHAGETINPWLLEGS